MKTEITLHRVTLEKLIEANENVLKTIDDEKLIEFYKGLIAAYKGMLSLFKEET